MKTPLILLRAAALLVLCATAAGQSYFYDADGRLAAERHANGQFFYYRYDRGGNVLESTTDVITPGQLPDISRSVGMPASIDLASGNPMGAHVYFATGLPPGWKVDPNTGVISGNPQSRTGAYRVSYYAQAGGKKSLVRTFGITITPLAPALAGSFEALMVDPQTRVPVGNLTVTVSPAAAFTARLQYADGVSGAFGTASWSGLVVVQNDGRGTARCMLGRSGRPALTLDWSVGPAGSFDATLRDGGNPLALATEGAARGRYSKTRPAPWRGVYTMILEGAVWTAGAPDGIGWACLTISETGQLRLTGKAADGTAITGAWESAENGDYLPFIPLTATGSRIGGVLRVRRDGGAYGANAGTGSEWQWVKAAAPKDKAYRPGFGPLKLVPTMKRWSPPATGAALSSVLPVGPGGIFGATIQGSGLDSTGLPTGSAGTPPPPFASGSDAFAARPTIPASGGAAAPVSNATASKETGEPAHNGNSGGHSLWWTWTPTASGTAVIDTIGSNFDTTLAVYTGTAVNALTAVASNDDGGGGGTSKVTVTVTAGTTYQIAVDGYGSSTGTVYLNVEPPSVVLPSTKPANTYGVPAWLKLDARNLVSTAEPAKAPLSGTFVPATGKFTATFTIKDTLTIGGKATTIARRVNAEGVLLGGSTEEFAGGFFTLPGLFAADPATSGLVIFSKTPPREINP